MTMANLAESSTALHLYLAEPTLTAARRVESDLPRERVVEKEFMRGTFSIDVSVLFSIANSDVVLGGLSEPHLFRGFTGLSAPGDTPALIESQPSASDNA